MAAVEIFFHRVLTDDRWMNQAACKGLTHESAAKSVCASCIVHSACQEYARTNHEYGFWGGESEDERHSAGYRLIAPIGVRARNVS
jgi:WhiB family redox-sensing transcriptional regulator